MKPERLPALYYRYGIWTRDPAKQVALALANNTGCRCEAAQEGDRK